MKKKLEACENHFLKLILLKQKFAARKLNACREQQYIESLKNSGKLAQ